MVDVFFLSALGFVYVLDSGGETKGTILPLILLDAPLLQDSDHRWWPRFSAGDTVSHYRFQTHGIPNRQYAVVEDEEDQYGRVSVQYSDASALIPAHLLEVIPHSDGVIGSYRNTNHTISVLDQLSIEGTEPWTVAGFSGGDILYKGPLFYQTAIFDPKHATGKPLYRFMDPVLLQTKPEEISGRFVVMGVTTMPDERREHYYCCRPISHMRDLKGPVWLPETAIYHVETWFRELRMFDPLPMFLRYPLPPLKIDWKVYNPSMIPNQTAAQEEREEAPEKLNPMLLGAGVLGLFVLVNES